MNKFWANIVFYGIIIFYIIGLIWVTITWKDADWSHFLLTGVIIAILLYATYIHYLINKE